MTEWSRTKSVLILIASMIFVAVGISSLLGRTSVDVPTDPTQRRPI